jgi:hypothetical protein
MYSCNPPTLNHAVPPGLPEVQQQAQAPQQPHHHQLLKPKEFNPNTPLQFHTVLPVNAAAFQQGANGYTFVNPYLQSQQFGFMQQQVATYAAANPNLLQTPVRSTNPASDLTSPTKSPGRAMAAELLLGLRTSPTESSPPGGGVSFSNADEVSRTPPTPFQTAPYPPPSDRPSFLVRSCI